MLIHPVGKRGPRVEVRITAAVLPSTLYRLITKERYYYHNTMLLPSYCPNPYHREIPSLSYSHDLDRRNLLEELNRHGSWPQSTTCIPQTCRLSLAS